MEAQRRLAQAVAELAEPYRTTVFLRFFEDLTPSEIATRSHEPPGTVRSRLKRALDLLRAKLDGEHGGDRRACCLALAALAGIREAPATLAPVAVRSLVALIAACVVVALGVVLLLRPEAGGAARRFADARVTEDASSDTAAPVAAASAHAPTGRAMRVLQGRVEAAWGAPIAGAIVVVAVAPLGSRRPRSTLPVATATTMADGAFRFEVESSETYRVAAAATGFAWKEVRPGPRTHGLLLRLFPYRRLQGVVVDEAGAPVGGARVLLPDFPGEGALTGPDGAFEVEAGPEGVDLLVEHPRFVPTWTSERHAPVRVVLGAPEVLAGIVLDAGGRPVPGADVTVWARGAYDVRTDSSGRFRIDGFGAGRAGEADEEGPPRFWMRVDAGSRGWRFLDKLVWTPGHELRIVLPAVRTFHGRATQDGRPVADFRIALQPGSGAGETSFAVERPIAETATDEDGRLTFQVASSAREIVLKPLDDGYVFAPPFNGYLPGDADNVDLALVRPPYAGGRVFGADGEPIVGAPVWLEEPGRPQPGPPRWALSTDDEGRFRLLVPFWPTGAVVRAANEGCEIATSEPLVAEAGREYGIELRLVALDAQHDIAGAVVTKGGDPLAMVHVVAQSQKLRDGGEAYSAPDGTFRVRGLKEGVYQVSASWPFGRGMTTEAATGAPLRITLENPPPPEPPGIPAQAAEAAGAEHLSFITGRVLDAEGEPFPYDSVPGIFWKRETPPGEGRRHGGGGGWGRVRCDLDGRFEIRVPEEGTFTLEVQGVWPPVFGPLAGVSAGTRDLVLQPSRKAGVITGRIVLHDGRPPRWPSLDVVPREKVGPDGCPRATQGHWSGDGAGQIDKDGRFRIEGLVAEQYVLVAYDEEHPVAFRPATVGDDVEIVLEPGLPLSGTVVLTDGTPPSDAIVRVEDSVGLVRQSRTGPRGEFTVLGLADGPCTVKALGEERRLAVVEVRPGAKDLRIVLQQYDQEEFDRRTNGTPREGR